MPYPTTTSNNSALFSGGVKKVAATPTGSQLAGTVLPDLDNTYNLGSASLRLATLYGVTFSGNAVTANYADLAEKYTCKDQVIPGQVILISRDDNYDCELSKEFCSTRILGVVSTNPAFIMNEECSGPVICRVGKVPCFVKGPVNKGDLLISDFNGVACAMPIFIQTPGVILGRANQTIKDNITQLIEIIM